MVIMYHERQEAALCGQHCLNNLLQGPYFSASSLAQIAQALDEQEAKLMLEAGMTSEARAFLSQESANVDPSGNFSIQVLSTALQNMFGIQLEDSRRPENKNAMQRPDSQTGFVLNRHSHWYCLRKLDNQWWSCNSTQSAPEKITSSGNFSGLASTLRELVSDNWTVFIVKGDKWPPPAPRNQGAPPSNWVDPAHPPPDPHDPHAEVAFSNKAARREDPKFTAFAGEGRTLGGGGGGSGGGAVDMSKLSEEEQLAMALSLSQNLAQQARVPSEALVLDEGAPTTTLQVRMGDGSRKIVKANHTHTVAQLKAHVATFAPGVSFSLKGGFPPKPLEDDSLSLADAKLLNESIVFSPA
uniref:ubiquitinyl hydrolase 1 n=1 Tax=Haptolina brevifila TaxID=156173 RepID=A0A7S2CLB9_9EUKA